MKRNVASFMVSVMVFALLAAAIGSTFATFSDSETSQNNCIETGYLDLKVNDRDDGPWGGGVGAIMQITDAVAGSWYRSTVQLWNAGDTPGTVYLKLKIPDGAVGLAALTSVEIWFSDKLVRTGSADYMNNQEIGLGTLPSKQLRELTLALRANEGLPGDQFDFSLHFDLIGSWSDSEVSDGNLFRLVSP